MLWLREDKRTYNAKQLSQRLKEKRGIEISPAHLRRILKKRGIAWKRTRTSHKNKQDPEEKTIKQADLDMLELSTAAGEIDSYYSDESGCSPWSEPSYSYYFEGNRSVKHRQKRRVVD